MIKRSIQALRPSVLASGCESRNSSPSPESPIQEAWRWRGPFIFFLLGLREICRPLFYWHVFDIFEINLVRQGVPEPYSAEAVDVVTYPGTGNLEKAKAEIVSMRQLQPAEVTSRFDRGDKVAIGYIGGEPTGYAWMSFTSGVVELAFKTTWIVGPGESIRYDSFVLPKWRGRRIHSCLHSAILAYARRAGMLRSFASISVFNTQSMSLAKRYKRIAMMRVMLLHIRGLDWTIRWSGGVPFESRFSKLP